MAGAVPPVVRTILLLGIQSADALDEREIDWERRFYTSVALMLLLANGALNLLVGVSAPILLLQLCEANLAKCMATWHQIRLALVHESATLRILLVFTSIIVRHEAHLAREDFFKSHVGLATS